ncbi:MAG TPA: hypothetical protein VF676_05185 [Flavobacterium sp.]|jgi:hypothetical protein
MKEILFMLLLSTGAFAQPQVFNVQKYCIDEKPLFKGQCDLSGNEYSFVFVDSGKKEVVFFLTDTKFKYKIIEISKALDYTLYKLKDGAEDVEMKINTAKTKIEFLQPDRHVLLTVGSSTKL